MNDQHDRRDHDHRDRDRRPNHPRGGGSGGRSREAPLPKPYAFVPLPTTSITKQHPVGHDRYRSHQNILSGTLKAHIIVRSPVHIASGLLEQSNDPEYPLIKAHFRTRETLAIPGSSLKGCLRSVAEAITRSSVQVAKRMNDIPFEYRPASLDQARKRTHVDLTQRIFGAMGYQGQIRISDALMREGQAIIVPSPQLFSPIARKGDAYFDGANPRGRKFYMHGTLAKGDLPLEACAIDSVFDLRLEFENLTPGEIGTILCAMGLGETRFCLKLGGSKPSCLGTVEIADPYIEALNPEAAYTAFDFTSAVLDQKELSLLLHFAKAEKLVLNEQLQRVADILRWPRDDNRTCADRNY